MQKARPLTKAQYEHLVEMRLILNMTRNRHLIHENEATGRILAMTEAAVQIEFDRVKLAQKVIRLPHYFDTDMAI